MEGDPRRGKGEQAWILYIQEAADAGDIQQVKRDPYWFLRQLAGRKIHFEVGSSHEDTFTVTAVVPGERWDALYFRDGTLKVERYVSGGRILNECALVDLPFDLGEAQRDIFRLLEQLAARGIGCQMSAYRDDYIMVVVRVPGEYWEVEFSSEGEVEVEIYRSDGRLLDEASFSDLFERYSD